VRRAASKRMRASYSHSRYGLIVSLKVVEVHPLDESLGGLHGVKNVLKIEPVVPHIVAISLNT
jgi:hypothetical protein